MCTYQFKNEYSIIPITASNSPQSYIFLIQVRHYNLIDDFSIRVPRQMMYIWLNNDYEFICFQQLFQSDRVIHEYLSLIERNHIQWFIEVTEMTEEET